MDVKEGVFCGQCYASVPADANKCDHCGTHLAVTDASQQKALTYNVVVVNLATVLRELYDLSELKDLVFRLHFDYEHIPGNDGTKTSAANAIVKFFLRQNRLADLVAQMRKDRPHRNF